MLAKLNVMRKLTICLLSLCPLSTNAQNEVTIYGRVRELSVGPDQSIWLTTATGNIYYTENIEAKWKLGMQKNPGVNYLVSAPRLDRILFFNNDTAIIYGYISENFYEDKKNKVYRTTNGGKSWKLVEFAKGDVWIREGQIRDNGKIWLAGSKGRIYHSSDYGLTWVKLPKIFGWEKEAYYRKPQIYSIHYENDSSAIATNRSNHLATTKSNFSNTTRIATPLDQGLFEKKYKPYYLNGKGRKHVVNFKIDKVRIFHDSYAIFQNGTFYYTDRNKIEWKKFSKELYVFEIDPQSGKLYAVTKDLEIVEIDEHFNFILLNPKKMMYPPIDMQIIDGNVFVLVPEYEFDIARDKVRDQYGGFTIVEKNYKKLKSYFVYLVNATEFKVWNSEIE